MITQRSFNDSAGFSLLFNNTTALCDFLVGFTEEPEED